RTAAAAAPGRRGRRRKAPRKSEASWQDASSSQRPRKSAQRKDGKAGHGGDGDHGGDGERRAQRPVGGATELGLDGVGDHYAFGAADEARRDVIADGRDHHD